MDSVIYDFTIPSIVYAFLAVISVFMGIALVRKRKIPGTVPLMWFYFALFIWAFAYIFESAALRVEQKLFWSQVAYIGTLATPVLLLAFAQEFTNRRILNRTAYWVIASIIPVLTLVFAWSRNLRHWVWPEIVISGPNHLAVYHHGPWFWVFFAYTYLIILGSLLLLVLSALRNYRIFRSQSVLTILAALAVVSGNILYIIPNNPIPGMEWTLAGFIITSIILALGILRYKLFDLVPAARGALVEIMSEGVLLADDQGRIIDVNPSFLRLVGAPYFENYLGRPIRAILQSAPSVLQIFLLPKIEGKHLRTEIVMGEKVLDVSLTELKEPGKSLKGRLLVVNDISSLKITENALHETNLILSEENIKRQKLISELDAYAHTVAHDLKTPLNGIAGFSELLIDELEAGNTGQAADYAGIINDSAFKMVHIIEELLLLSSVRSEEIKRSVVDMEAVFFSAKKRLQATIEETQAQISVSGSWPSVDGYAPWIEEVWVNYLSNALKYGGRPPEIRIFTKEDAEYVWYCVEDNGPGIPEEDLNKLFIAYTRLSPKNAEGHGLGLSIVKRIIDKLGGAVQAENQANSGCCFSFGLPRSAVNS